MTFGLFILRVVVGLLFVGHGTQKLFGWFDGPGPDGTRKMYRSLDYRRPAVMAVLAGLSEAGGGLLLALGLLTPLAAAAIIGVMVNAIATVHAPNGLWNTNGGFEYDLVLMTAATTTSFAGPGNWSLDAAIGWNLTGWAWGILAVAVGVFAAGAVLAMRDTTTAARAEPTTTPETQREPEREHQPA